MEGTANKVGETYEVKLSLTLDDIKAYEALEKEPDFSAVRKPGIQPMGIFDSKHYCVSVSDSAGRLIYRETIKTHPLWAPIRALGVMRDHGGSGYTLVGGECS